MSFLGVKVILFWVIPLIIKEKSNASALHRPFSMFITVVVNMSIDRSPCSQRSMRHDFQMGFTRF